MRLDRLAETGRQPDLDGRQRAIIDNIFIERLWPSRKYECVYLTAWETGSQARTGVSRSITFSNHQRSHAAHGGQPPALVSYYQIKTDQQGQRAA